MLNVIQEIKDRIQGKAQKGEKRSGSWTQVRNEHVEKHPACEVCGRTTKVQVHHLIPFHVAPDLELEPDNLMTLCENKKNGINCHLLVGHLGNFRRFNVTAVEDATYWKQKLGK